LLAECEGVFAETAGGVTVGVAKKLIAQGKIAADSSAVLCITGNGLKTLDAVVGHVGETRDIRPSLREFEGLLAQERGAVAVAAGR
jgi:threonine synthase